MLEPDKEYKNVFPEFSIVGLRNGKSLKEYLVRGALPKIDSARGSKPGGKGTCQLTLLQQKYVGMYLKLKADPLTVIQKSFFTFWDAEPVMILCVLKNKVLSLV